MPPLLEATGIHKQFPGVLALDGVSCSLAAGEVLAVVGENGAGKSTLMKVIAGVYQPDAGAVTLDGIPVRFPTPQAAMVAGVSLIHQELNLADNLSVQDNLFLGREKTVGGPFKLLNRGAMAEHGAKLLRRVGLPVGFLSKPVGELPPGQKQLVEIARALGLNARVLIMDEPTSSLTQPETDRLYEVIAALKAACVGVMYISHRLAEIKKCCDRAVVLRDGKNAGELAKADITHDNLVRLMVGRDLKTFFPRTRRTDAGHAVLQLRDLTYAGGPPHPVSLDVRAGEVLGMAGLVGAGRTELSEAVFGIRTVTGGEVQLNGEPLRVSKPADAVRAGVLLVPEDRRRNGLVLELGVGFNLSLPNLDRLRSALLVDRTAERTMHADSIAKLRVRTPNADQSVGLLSGGNQQKVVFGKWLARGPTVLILDEPTRGVDVGAKTEIYALIDELAGRGVAVWMITSDLEELLGVSDRVVVMHEGRLAGELSRGQLSEEAVMRLATGVLSPSPPGERGTGKGNPMNEKAKFAACLGAGAAVTGGIWFAAKLPFDGPHSTWFVLAALALAALAHTFELTRRNLQRTAGVTLLLAGLFVVLARVHPNPFGSLVLNGLLNRHGEYGLYCLGAGLLILAGGIDLSVGSVIVLAAVTFGKLMMLGVPPLVAAGVVLLGGVLLGALHGLLVTQLRLQAFLVTLCGMFVYRGVARSIQKGQIGRVSVKERLGEDGSAFEQSFFDLRYWLTGQAPPPVEETVFPAQLVLFLGLAAVAAVFLHRTTFGRYWYAIGNNEQAARYAGVTVWKHKVTVFATCSGLAALGGVVLFLRAGSITPSSEGSAYELYAITAAVLGGVSLRGGEGTAVGMTLGALVLPLMNQVMKAADLPDAWEPWLIGLILLGGAVVDETIRRRGRRS